VAERTSPSQRFRGRPQAVLPNFVLRRPALVLVFGVLLAGCGDSATSNGTSGQGAGNSDLGADPGTPDAGRADAGAQDLGPVDGPCGADAPIGDPEITIGTGRDAFEPVCQGDTLSWVAGMQGSFHLEGGVRISPEVVAGLSAQERTEIVHEYKVTDVQTAGEATDRELIDDGDQPVPVFREGPDGSLETFDVFLVIDSGFLDGRPDPSFASGQTLRYEVFVTLPDGTRYTQSVEVQSTCCS